MLDPIELISRSVSDTLAIGRTVATTLAAGDVIGLVGCLGAGKTHLVKGVAAGLGVADERIINSPTFVLVNEYEGRLHVYHVDAYRLPGPRELEAVGFEEMCSSEGVVLVEWADRVAKALPEGCLWVELTVAGESVRRITLRTDLPVLRRRLEDAGLDPWRHG